MYICKRKYKGVQTLVIKDSKTLIAVGLHAESYEGLFIRTMSEKILVKQILRLCEKQYRKGLQHGANFLNDKEVTLNQVDQFRWSGSKSDYKIAKDIRAGYKIDLISKLVVECMMADMDELSILLSESRREKTRKATLKKESTLKTPH